MSSGTRPARGSGFADRVAERRDAGLLRTQQAVSDRRGADMIIDGRPQLNFCSNDYLGLAGHPRLIEAWSRAAEKYGVGAGASPLVCGRFDVHAELEQALAEFTGRERALIFADGYQANLAVLSVLAAERRDRIIMDRLCHASLIDGALLSRARLLRFPHADAQALAARLAGADNGLTLVVTESLFSMDGDIAPLPAYAALCAQHGALLFVDDAHGFGVLGASGRGGTEHYGLCRDELPVIMATFGKALGVAGAFVAGPGDVIEALIQFARPYIYSTAMPPPQAAAVLESLAVMQEEDWRRRQLLDRIAEFRAGAVRLGLPLTDSVTPIQPLILGPAADAVAVSEKLQRQGFYVAAIRPPTVPQNSARLRITLSAAHSSGHIDDLLSSLAGALPG